jgi:hypothetical protein
MEAMNVERNKKSKSQFTCIGIGGPRFCGWALEPIMGGLGGCLYKTIKMISTMYTTDDMTK